MCFSRQEGHAAQYQVFCQFFENLRFGIPSPRGPEFLALRAADADASIHVYIPYLFPRNGGFGMMFTARGSKKLDTDEWIGLAESSNGTDWTVRIPRAFEASLAWEANDVENFGLLEYDQVLWMNYESTGPSGLEADRAIGIAYSTDLGETWTRVQDEPSLTGGVYCAGFFVWQSEVYLIASAHNQFRVYRASHPTLLSDDSYIGSFMPQPEGIVVDTPSVITDTVEKQIGESFSLTYSLMEAGLWNTYLTRWPSTEEFLAGLEQLPLDPPG